MKEQPKTVPIISDTMKRILSAAILLAGIILIPPSVKAQEHSDCFMLDENGQSIDMGELCGGTPLNPTPNPNRNTLGSGVFQAQIKRRVSGIPVINVKFNGHKTYEMMVDTGASNTVLTVEVAQSLKLQPQGVALVNTPSDTKVPFPLTSVSSMEAGGIVAKNVVVVVSPSLPMGLLGQDFLGNFDVTIKKHIIEFRARWLW